MLFYHNGYYSVLQSLFIYLSLDSELLEGKNHALVVLPLTQRFLYVYKNGRKGVGKEEFVSEGEINDGYLYMERWK